MSDLAQPVVALRMLQVAKNGIHFGKVHRRLVGHPAASKHESSCRSRGLKDSQGLFMSAFMAQLVH